MNKKIVGIVNQKVSEIQTELTRNSRGQLWQKKNRVAEKVSKIQTQ